MARTEPDGSDPAAASAAPSPDAQRLAAVVDAWYERWLELNPLTASEQGDHRYDAQFGDYLSPTWLANSLANEQDSLEDLRDVDPAGLSDRTASPTTPSSTAARSRSRDTGIRPSFCPSTSSSDGRRSSR